MSDHNIEYSKQFDINTFKREIIRELGEEAWHELTFDMVIPDVNNESRCKCVNMVLFMQRFNDITDQNTVKKILAKVRHGLIPSQCAWAREKFLQIGDLDSFILKQRQETLADFQKLFDEGKDFYGDTITEEVLDFIKNNPAMLSGVRDGNKLFITAFPFRMMNYLQATESKMKRYYACHCPFARESILAEKVVSKTLCYCSLGHVKNFWEAVFDVELDGEVLTSALAGDENCSYVIFIPDEIMKKHVNR